MKKDTVYLGNLLIFGRRKAKEFGRLKDMLQGRLEGWQSQLLSRAGRATLIKAVAQAIPVYTMSTFRVPNGVCQEMDAMIRRLWWNGNRKARRFLALKSWDDICLPKAMEGLGFRSFKLLNTALLAKLGWKLACGDEGLWVSLMKAKYLKFSSFFGCHVKLGDSEVWRGILNTKEDIQKAPVIV